MKIERPDPSSPTRAYLFLGAIYVALQAFLWFVVPTRHSILIAIGAVLILIVMIGAPIRRRESWSDLGLGLKHFGTAFRVAAPVTLLAMAALLGLNQLLPDAPIPTWPRLWKRVLNILPWALLQQGLLQTTFNRRLTAALGPGWWSSALVGAAFGGMHLPNPLLMLLTAGAGTLWARLYQRAPNLWLLVASHALLSAAAQACLPAVWTHGFRVGPGYFRWHP